MDAADRGAFRVLYAAQRLPWLKVAKPRYILAILLQKPLFNCLKALGRPSELYATHIRVPTSRTFEYALHTVDLVAAHGTLRAAPVVALGAGLAQAELRTGGRSGCR